MQKRHEWCQLSSVKVARPVDLYHSPMFADDLFELFARPIQQENEFCKLIDLKETSLENMTRAEQLDKVSALLDRSPELVNCSSDYDLRWMTALERAVDTCNIPLVEMLFKRGADPNNNKYTGELPSMASAYGHTDPDFMKAYPLGYIGFDVPENERTIPGFGGLYPLCDPDDPDLDDEWKERCSNMHAWLKCYRMKSLLTKLKEPLLQIKVRGIVLYWKHAAYAPNSKAMKAAEARFNTASIN